MPRPGCRSSLNREAAGFLEHAHIKAAFGLWGLYQWKAAHPQNLPLRNPICDYTHDGALSECPMPECHCVTKVTMGF